MENFTYTMQLYNPRSLSYEYFMNSYGESNEAKIVFNYKNDIYAYTNIDFILKHSKGNENYIEFIIRYPYNNENEIASFFNKKDYNRVIEIFIKFNYNKPSIISDTIKLHTKIMNVINDKPDMHQISYVFCDNSVKDILDKIRLFRYNISIDINFFKFHTLEEIEKK